MGPLHYESTPYDRTKHEGFVKASWLSGAREVRMTIGRTPRNRHIPAGHPHADLGPTPRRQAEETWEVLSRFLRHPDTHSRVAHLPGKPDDLIGWAVVNRGRVVWAYTRRLFGKLRRRGLMTSLLLELGVDPSKPTPCLFWSPDAATIAARGYRFIFAPGGLKEAA